MLRNRLAIDQRTIISRNVAHVAPRKLLVTPISLSCFLISRWLIIGSFSRNWRRSTSAWRRFTSAWTSLTLMNDATCGSVARSIECSAASVRAAAVGSGDGCIAAPTPSMSKLFLRAGCGLSVCDCERVVHYQTLITPDAMKAQIPQCVSCVCVFVREGTREGERERETREFVDVRIRHRRACSVMVATVRGGVKLLSFSAPTSSPRYFFLDSTSLCYAARSCLL